ncbi:hypothetical protein MICCA_2730001 [Microcystis aeruginosa PCC 9432]|uniref:Uncharacterized protein n=2 Tax=Microcystis aeruginosa TaxID=1126 RepID=A0A822LC05_MICAE|nr:hypothetical protein MICCA_2730001 [Microcystis aeruginosa PCC 9432]CCI26845.1 hypothetical protein MICAG_3270001 [Microcystis aeruginosa PCC 9808]
MPYLTSSSLVPLSEKLDQLLLAYLFLICYFTFQGGFGIT